VRRKAATTSRDRLLQSRVESDGRTTELAGSSDHARAQRSPYSSSSRRLGGHGERRLISPGAQKARTACGRGPTRGATARHGAPGVAPRDGATRAASGNDAARRTGLPFGSATTTSGHGAASDAANRGTAAPRRAENRRTAAPRHAESRRTIASERTAPSECASLAIGARRPA
jgi:hypothetical protein